jgi:hypothetical protein
MPLPPNANFHGSDRRIPIKQSFRPGNRALRNLPQTPASLAWQISPSRNASPPIIHGVLRRIPDT